ncbi:MAG: cyclic nucleotide-binding protein [Devosia sp.]|uniref:Crp/Fnr family transcriptional regulator n=1 Tax=Devosia sp. TaxID=1871048 RepID=UPI00262A15D3|nr:cyclic nucleotide-binding domain-containing protein [Devosia sp.]MDB5538557.1 cyclic nucleotide-binding protein [Devosia sp.]
MTTLAALTVTLPQQRLAPGTALTTEGSHSGRLYLLESGRLAVSREGVALATIDEPGAIIGEMAVLLGIPHSATVTAQTEAQVRVIDDALDVLAENPDFALHLATLACARLNATSALLVELRRAAAGKKQEQALMSRILMAMMATPKGVSGGSRRWVDHE